MTWNVERYDKNRRTFLYVLRAGETGNYLPVEAETFSDAVSTLYEREHSSLKDDDPIEVLPTEKGVVIIRYE